MGEPVPGLSWLAQAVALHQLAEHTVIFKRDRAMIVTPKREGSMGWSAAERSETQPLEPKHWASMFLGILAGADVDG